MPNGSWDEPDRNEDERGHDDEVIQLTQDRNKIGDDIKRRDNIGHGHAKQNLADFGDTGIV